MCIRDRTYCLKSFPIIPMFLFDHGRFDEHVQPAFLFVVLVRAEDPFEHRYAGDEGQPLRAFLVRLPVDEMCIRDRSGPISI